MQSFKATVRKKYRLVRGHLTYLTRVSTEMLNPRSQSFMMSVNTPYIKSNSMEHRMPNTSFYLSIDRTTVEHLEVNARWRPSSSRPNFFESTIEVFCGCGCHETIYLQRSTYYSGRMPISGLSCTSCGQPYSEFNAQTFMPAHYNEKKMALTATEVRFDCITLFDDFLEKGKLSLKIMGHRTYYNPNRVKLYSSDLTTKLIYSHKNGRMYLYNGKAVFDITYQLDEQIGIISSQYDLYRPHRELMESEQDDPFITSEIKSFPVSSSPKYRDEERDYSRYYFGDFLKRVYDVIDKSAWAPQFNELKPAYSVKAALMSNIAPLCQSMFSHYEQNAISKELGKTLRHFRKESDALDMMLHQPSGHYRKLVRSAIDTMEVSILNNIAFNVAGLFKEPSHLNNLLSHASQVYRDYVQSEMFYEHDTHHMDRILGSIPSQRHHFLRQAELFGFDKMMESSNKALSISMMDTGGHDGRLNFPVTVHLKNNRVAFKRSDSCLTLHGFRKRFGISDRRLMDILKYSITNAIQHNPEYPLSFISTMRDMSRLLDTIRSNCEDYTPKMGLDMYEAEKRLSVLVKRVGVIEYPFDYNEERLSLQGEFDGHSFRLPETSGELLNIGNRLDHCVGGYHSIVQSGGSTIVVVEREGYYILAIEVIGKKVTQIKGLGNNLGYHIPSPVKNAVKSWIHRNKLTLDTKDLNASGGDAIPYIPSDYKPIDKIAFDKASLDAIYRARIQQDGHGVGVFTRTSPIKRITKVEAVDIFNEGIERIKKSLVGHEDQMSMIAEPQSPEQVSFGIHPDDLPF